MKFKVVLWTCLALMVVVPVLAQRAKTVTNLDLEKYREKRLKAERDYNENYARMGFPSPEELQKQIEKSRLEREQLAARLTAERIQRERIEAERDETLRSSQQTIYVIPDYRTPGSYFYGYPNRFFDRRRFGPIFQYSPPVKAGNGIPISGGNWYPPIRPTQAPIRMGRQ